MTEPREIAVAKTPSTGELTFSLTAAIAGPGPLSRGPRPPVARVEVPLMSPLATLRRSMLASIALALTALVALPVCAGAQVDPTWDHYKAYHVQPPVPFGVGILLNDQFGSYSHQVLELSMFANPTEKQTDDGTVSPINDPRLHYAWWLISPYPFDRLVAATNQFGDQTFRLAAPRFLWNPALKNEPDSGPPPLANHYKCYDCVGAPINRIVTLTDQFGIWQTLVTEPRLFCNPAEKAVVGGPSYPIVDPRQHYVCYEFDLDPRTFTAVITDQFLRDQPVALGPSNLLCVPTDKVDPTPTSRGTWGRVKTMYR